MFILAHTGITLSAAVLIAGGLTSGHPSQVKEGGETMTPRRSSNSVLARLSFLLQQASSWLTALGKRIDIRLLLIGALLPDIIDKPIAHLFFSEIFDTGRIFSHTLLFLVFITLLGLYLYRSREKLWLLVLAFGTMTHLILDQMWQRSQTLLWPLLGYPFHSHTGKTFYPADIVDWVPNTLENLVKDPTQYVPELMGAVILAWFAWILLRRKKVLFFIRSGKIG